MQNKERESKQILERVINTDKRIEYQDIVQLDTVESLNSPKLK
jgi:archaellum biogenesis ATPase FlaH